LPIDYSQLLSCNYGTTALSVESYAVKESAIVQDGIGRTGTDVQVGIDAFLVAADQNDLLAKMVALDADLNTDGRDLLIFGLAGLPEFSLLAAQCQNGGPQIDFEILPGPTALVKVIKITAHTTKLPTGKGQINQYKVSVRTRPDLLRTITWDGMVNYVDNATQFLTVIVPQFTTAYPLPNWVHEYEYSTAQDGVQDKLSYRISARENYAPLPDFKQIGNAVDGQASQKIDRDEQMRKVTTWDFNLLVFAADPVAFVSQLRAQITVPRLPGLPPRIILRESLAFETIKENRLQASFTVLESADKSSVLLNFSQTMKVLSSHIVYEEKIYFGAAPVLVAVPQKLGRVTVSGSAIGAGRYMQSPGGAAFHYRPAPPETTYTEINAVEKQTSWNDAFFLTNDDGTPRSKEPAPDFIARQDTEPKFFPVNPVNP
jgi:hypothetical protein